MKKTSMNPGDPKNKPSPAAKEEILGASEVPRKEAINMKKTSKIPDDPKNKPSPAAKEELLGASEVARRKAINMKKTSKIPDDPKNKTSPAAKEEILGSSEVQRKKAINMKKTSKIPGDLKKKPRSSAKEEISDASEVAHKKAINMKKASKIPGDTENKPSSAAKKEISDASKVPRKKAIHMKKTSKIPGDPKNKPSHAKKEEIEKMCDVCFKTVRSSKFPSTRLTCKHTCCRECLESYFKERIVSGFISIRCPWNGCEQTYSPADITSILKTPRWREKYSRLSLTKALLNNSETRFCPGVDCQYAVFVPAGIQCPVLTCENRNCGVKFCCKCSEVWCDQHQCKQKERLPETKRCPGCKVPVHKIADGACNEMTCRICGKSFCWLCLQELNSWYNHDHFRLECPLYGKKRFGKVRQMFNRAAYVGEAVVGIPLAVGAAAGAIIAASAVTTVAGAVSSPVFLAKELVKREKARESSTTRQRLALTGGAAVGAIGMPVLAPWGIYMTYRKINKKICNAVTEFAERGSQEDLEERRVDR